MASTLKIVICALLISTKELAKTVCYHLNINKKAHHVKFHILSKPHIQAMWPSYKAILYRKIETKLNT